MPGADRERKRPAVEAEVAEDGDLVADVCDTPVEPGLLIGEHVPHEGCTLRLPFLCRFVRHHQHRVVGKDIDERIGVEGVLASLQAFRMACSACTSSGAGAVKPSNMSSPECRDAVMLIDASSLADDRQ
jgi:hypothetical protein